MTGSLADSPIVEVVSRWVDDAKDAADRAVDALRGTSTGRRVQSVLDRRVAEWRWSGHPLLPQARLPVHSSPDERTLLAGLGLARVLAECAADSSSQALPPVTTALVLANAVVFFKPNGVVLRDVCLSPYCVVEKGEYMRLITPAFVHFDATHLLSNLAAALPDCLLLERDGGSERFLAELGGLTLLSHGLYVGYAWAQKQWFGSRSTYYSVGGVGLSSVAFALQVVAGHRVPGAKAAILGLVPIPARLAWVWQLAATHAFNPDLSFPAHLCGVVAGLAHVLVVEPAVNWALSRGQGRGGGSRPAQFFGAGTGGGASLAPLQERHRRRSWWKAWAKELLLQAGLAASATLLYTAYIRRGSRSSINTWRY